jgi:hypothetical protein
MVGAVPRLLVLLLLLNLSCELRQALLVFWENGVYWEVNIAVGLYAAKLLGNVTRLHETRGAILSTEIHNRVKSLAQGTSDSVILRIIEGIEPVGSSDITPSY